jgi:hypothetical protein
MRSTAKRNWVKSSIRRPGRIKRAAKRDNLSVTEEARKMARQTWQLPQEETGNHKEKQVSIKAIRTASFGAQENQESAQGEQSAEQTSPAAIQLRESFEQIVSLKKELETVTNERNTAIAQIAILKSDGKVAGLAPGAFTEHQDGSVTLPITLDSNIMPSIRAQYEGGELGGMTLEEYIREQIIAPAIECYQGNF